MSLFTTIGEWANIILDPVFRPIAGLGPFWATLIISFLISLLITVIYKYTTDQAMMKNLKDTMKRLQQEAKASRSDPAKMMRINKETMEKNMSYMMHSLKATLYTFIPIILIFSWLNVNMAYEPIQPGMNFDTNMYLKEGVKGSVRLDAPGFEAVSGNLTQEILNNKVGWTLKSGKEGIYTLAYSLENKDYFTEVLIKKDMGYKMPMKMIKDGIVNYIEVVHKKIIVMNLFGWKVGWLGGYIIFSLIFSLGLRKLMKVY